MSEPAPLPSPGMLRPRTALALPRAILFDMDGTLTCPMLDFPLIKREMGIGSQPILEALAQLTGEALARAQAVLDRHEQHAATHSTLNPGCLELLAWLAQQRIDAALITRNSRRNVETVLKLHGLKLEILLCREDGPFKPSPQPLLEACRRLDLPIDAVWMVGDGWYDIAAGNAAGIHTIWISHGQLRDFDAVPDQTVGDLMKLLGLLRSL